jgi:TPP-dependent pyruvate/acetoin dehydrogenase alpha subunit
MSVGNNIYKIAEPFCIESYDVDGNDVLEIYKVGKEAIKCRRPGPGVYRVFDLSVSGHVGRMTTFREPTLIFALKKRLRGGCKRSDYTIRGLPLEQ